MLAVGFCSLSKSWLIEFLKPAAHLHYAGGCGLSGGCSAAAAAANLKVKLGHISINTLYEHRCLKLPSNKKQAPRNVKFPASNRKSMSIANLQPAAAAPLASTNPHLQRG